MKTKNSFFWILIVCLLNIILSGCKKEYSEDILLVKKAFEYLNEDNTDGLLSIVSSPYMDSRTLKKNLGGYIHASEIEILVDEMYPNQVFFSCNIQGAATVAINNLLNRKFNRKASEAMSSSIALNGSANILTDSKTGKKRIDISEGSDPFLLCLNIAYNRMFDSPINLRDLSTEDDFATAVSQVAWVVGLAYSSIVDDEDYFSDIFMPDLSRVFDENILEAILQVESWDNNNTLGFKGKDETNIKITDNTKVSRQKNASARAESDKNNGLKQINITYRIVIYITVILSLIIALGYMVQAIIKKNKRKKELQKIRETVPFFNQVKSFTSLIGTSTNSMSKYKIRYLLEESSNYKQEQILFGAYSHEKAEASKTTRVGWSLAALGRLITQDCTPEKFQECLEKYEKEVIPKYNNDLSKYESERQDLIAMQGITDDDIARRVFYQHRKNKYDLFEALSKKLEKGILAYAYEMNVLPFAFFMQVIADNQSYFDRYIRQGAIMGLIDYFMKYKDNEIIKPYFETLIAARASLISSDNQMSFFEVRAPKECTAKQYAAILKEVLHCSNPTIKYCDTEKLMKIAEKEIPGIMDLLINYPLRLIDPGNDKTEGFYHFEPLRHAMWVNYMPPLNVGQVNRRYHEILDMTLPNSSGLNIRLFTDPYAAIPVMFHEYCHYMEDPNEASVFLKTYAFSLKFYRKYKQANPEKDFAFIALKRLLGKSNDPNNFQGLNNLILMYYGFPKSREEAISDANSFLNQKNQFIEYCNDEEKWCPEIKMPKLNDEEDKLNADLIKRIIIRYAQVPRTVTKEEFKIKRKLFSPLKSSAFKKYKTKLYDMLLPFKNVKENNKEIKCYESWKSFKDWCVEQGYITRYKGNEEIETYSDDNIELDINEILQKLYGGNKLI